MLRGELQTTGYEYKELQ